MSAASLGRALPKKSPTARSLLTRALPFLVSAVALYAIFRKYPAAEVAAQMRRGRPLAVAPLAFGLSVLYVLWGTLWDHAIVRRLGGRVTYGRLARGKMGAAVLSALGYLFGNGGYGVWLARAAGLGARESAGAVTFFVLSDLSAVGLVASIALALGGSSPGPLRLAAALLAVAQPAAIVAGPAFRRGGERGTLAPWRRVPRWLGLAQVLGRAANLLLMVSTTWLAARSFGLGVPFAAMVTYLPAVLLVGSLPVNVAGFGAAQGAWLYFFAPYAEGAQILAFVFLWQGAFAASLVVRGLPFVRATLDEIRHGEAGEPAASEAPPAPGPASSPPGRE